MIISFTAAFNSLLFETLYPAFISIGFGAVGQTLDTSNVVELAEIFEADSLVFAWNCSSHLIADSRDFIELYYFFVRSRRQVVHKQIFHRLT